jgi:small conductance mechanosensitive channel
MIAFSRLFAALLLLTALACPAQESGPSVSELQAQLEDIERDVTSLRLLYDALPSLSADQQNVLKFQLDTRLLRVLRLADQLAASLSTASPDDPLVSQFREQFQTDFEDVNAAIFRRLEDLETLITEAQEGLSERSGADWIKTMAEIDVFDALREQYLVFLARHLEIREKLGLENQALLPRVELLLRLRAEASAGRVAILSKMIGEYRQQRSAEANRADVDPLLARTVNRRAHVIEGLRTLTVAMESIGMDTRDYRSLLITEEGLSFGLFDSDVLSRLMEDWLAALRSFGANRGPDLLFNLLLFLAILFLFRLLSRQSRRLVQAGLDRSKADLSQLLKSTVVSLTGGLVMILGILVALSQIGVSVGPMLAGLGIAGFIVGFALQDTLGNFASGAMILIYRPFDVDDYVEITGASGLVKRMNLVSTTITTFDNQTLVVPNSKIWGDVIKNVTQQKVRRVDLEFGIGYEDDIPKAERILAEAAAEHELVLDSPETNVRVHSLGDSSVNLILRPWVKTEDYWTVYWDLTREVKLRFDREGVTIPFPQRDVHLYRPGPAD